MQFAGIINPYGTDTFEPVVNHPSHTFYYRGLRLTKTPVRIPDAPTPLFETIKNFLLTYDK